jgi:S-adenosylmethionine:tRNA ribosyltransferase-isomerase
LKPSTRLKVGERLVVEISRRPIDARPVKLAALGAEALCLEQRLDRGEWLVRPDPLANFLEFLDRFGQTPLPPYIERPGAPAAGDQERYQTVYAAHPGAVAAPTAGLHFTPELLRAIEEAGIRRAEVTLHVGLGTFLPVTVANLREHDMHAEWYEIEAVAAKQIADTRRAGGRIVAVGTTAARTLESLPRLGEPKSSAVENNGARGWTKLLIHPPYAFVNVDWLITNFHLPGSTLLALVMALAGENHIRRAYAEAIAREYRFFSYGDAMLIV